MEVKMSTNLKNKIVTVLLFCFFLGMGIMSWTKEQTEYSDSERRILAEKPEILKETILSGNYMTEFEAYSLDQFPFRENFRGIKAIIETLIFQKKDNNNIYLEDGYLSKIEYPKKESMMNHAAEHFENIYYQYCKEAAITPLFVIIPDKNAYLAEKNGILSMDYTEFVREMQEKTPFFDHMDISGLLEIKDFYRTDTHWRQEKIGTVAKKIAKQFDVELKEKYKIETLDVPFYGVYAGQWGLQVEPDTIQYLTSDWMKDCVITNYDTGYAVNIGMYDFKKAEGKDPYELFLSGSSALITIENPEADTEKELVIFRDSFGSSIAPYFAEAYKKVTLVDTRYVKSDIIGNFINFKDQDVLFLYSTLVLNNSLGFKN
jgi:hypothetical protein